MNREEAMNHARQWVEHWNENDIENIIAVHAQDAQFLSPTAKLLTGNAVVVGRNALRTYWSEAIERSPDRHFELDHAIWDPVARELAVIYTSKVAGRTKRACELMRFNERGEQIYGEALYGTES